MSDEPINPVVNDVETTDTINAEIERLQKKLEEAEKSELQQEEKLTTFPVADVLLKLSPQTEVLKQKVTPPELLLLVAEHKTGAKSNPVSKVTLCPEMKDVVEEVDGHTVVKQVPTGQNLKVNTDPRNLRRHLVGRYGDKRVKSVYPGIIPQMPTTFRAAINMGLETQLPGDKMITEYEVASGSGDKP